MSFIEVKDLKKSYDGHQALKGLSLCVEQGSIYGLLGPNGAGKTTFIRILNRIIVYDSGEIYFDGEPLEQKHINRIGYLPEERGLYRKMKVGEQIIYFAQLKGLTFGEAFRRTKKLMKKFDMLTWWNKKLEELSKGMQQKVQFLITIIHEPDLLIFDEPFSGFDPINQEMLKAEIQELNNKGKTILFSTHMMASVEEVCDSILLLNNGEKILEGPIDEVKKQHKHNIFSIIYQNAESNFVENEVFKIKERKNGDYLIQVTGEAEPNSLLRYAMQFGEIMHFEEVLPTLNEIFIQSVQNSNLKTVEQ